MTSDQADIAVDVNVWVVTATARHPRSSRPGKLGSRAGSAVTLHHLPASRVATTVRTVYNTYTLGLGKPFPQAIQAYVVKIRLL